MGIVVAVDRHHRALDLFSEFQKFSTTSQFRGIVPHTLIDMVIDLQTFGVEGQGVVGVGLGKQLPELNQKYIFLTDGGVIQGFHQGMGFPTLFFTEAA